MKNLSRIIMVAALLGGTLLLGSCTKSEFGQAGKLIQFGARADGASTKTAYAGKDNDASGIEPIWWMANDEVTIASPQAVVTNSNGEHQSTYKFKAYTSDNSHASVVNKGSNGLAWLDEDPDGGYDFYAVYGEGMSVGVNSGNEGMVSGEIPTSQGISEHKYESNGASANWYYVKEGEYTVYEPDMNYALMTAAKHVASSTVKTVDLTFYPAFTAFEFTFESADETVDIDLDAFEITSTTDALSGFFNGKAGNRVFSPVNTAPKSVSLSNPKEFGKVKKGEPKSFTIFAMPQNLTNLTIKFKDAEGTRILPLNYSNKKNEQGEYINGENHGQPLTFQSGHKYRIKGLKLPGNQYKFFLTLNGVVQEWDIIEAETNFSEQIQCSALTFDESAIEMTQAYKDANGGKTNHYSTVVEGVAAPVGDGRWQVRTLNASDGYDWFRVSFTPTAPLGGYWRLDTHGNEFFTVYMLQDPDNPLATELEDFDPVELPEYGRVMNQTVVLAVVPNWSVINAPANSGLSSIDIGLYFDISFSTNVEFDPTLNANTEFQDIHGAGNFSYWLLTVAK